MGLFGSGDDLVASLGIDDAGFKAGILGAGNALGSLGGVATAAGAAVGVAFIGAAAVTGIAVKAAIDLESAFAGVRKTVNGTEDELQAIKAGIMDLSTQVPVAATELFGIAEAAGQLGIAKENIVAFTKTVADLAATTNLGQDAAQDLARFMNIMGTSQNQVSNLGSTIVDLGNNFATTEREILEMAMRLAGAGRVVGMTEADVFGLATALSSVGIEAEAGGTAFSRIMLKMQKAVEQNGDELALFAKVSGKSAEEFANAWQRDAAGALTSFIQGIARVQREGGSVTGWLEALGLQNVRLTDAVLRSASAGDLLTNALTMSSRAFQENTALTIEAEKRYSTTESQLQIFQNRIFAVSSALGEKLLPAVNDVLVGVSALLAGDFAGFAAALERGAQTFWDVWKTTLANLGRAIVDRLGNLDGPAIAAALGQRFNEAVSWLGDAIKNVDWHAMGQAAGKALIKGGEWFIEFLKTVDWGQVVSVLFDAFRGLVGFLAGLFGELAGALGGILYNAGRDIVLGLLQGMWSMVGSLVATVQNIASVVVTTFKGWLGIASPSKVFAGLGEDVVQGFIVGVGDMTDSAVSAIGDIARAVTAEGRAMLRAPSTVGPAPRGNTTSVVFQPGAVVLHVAGGREGAESFARELRRLGVMG